MNGKKHSVKVTILNEDYTIRSDSPPEHTRAVAAYLDSAIREVMTVGLVVESGRASILAALRITAELFESRAAAAEITTALESLSSDIRRLLPPAKRGEKPV
ncbi:MAG TPA: cell division protein ZapA [Gemmatimonadaceae bacterium]|jgi:cell division protein ZapA (FtsZ GTPase activity inhibitor)